MPFITISGLKSKPWNPAHFFPLLTDHNWITTPIMIEQGRFTRQFRCHLPSWLLWIMPELSGIVTSLLCVLSTVYPQVQVHQTQVQLWPRPHHGWAPYTLSLVSSAASALHVAETSTRERKTSRRRLCRKPLGPRLSLSASLATVWLKTDCYVQIHRLLCHMIGANSHNLEVWNNTLLENAVSNLNFTINRWIRFTTIWHWLEMKKYDLFHLDLQS